MINKSVDFLKFRKGFLATLTKDSGGIFKYIQTNNITEFSDKYNNFISYLKSTGFGNVIAITSIENYILLQEEHSIYKERLKSTTDQNILEDVYNVPTIIFKKSNLFDLSNDFPKDKILLLSCDEKYQRVEITENKFAVVTVGQ